MCQVEFVDIKRSSPNLVSQSSPPELSVPNGIKRVLQKLLGRVGSEKMHRVGFIDKGVYLESHKGPHRCCIYWKKDQIMRKCRELGHDGPRKGSWKMEV